jgi:tetratricopeptide (TPR) repeat protein
VSVGFLAATGRPDPAIDVYREILALDPDNVAARIDLADTLQAAKQDPAAAVPLYREALARAPDHAGARYALGNALLRLGRLPEARTELRAAAAASPGNPLPLQSLAVLEMRAQQPAAALAALDAAQAMRPRSAEIMTERGGVLLALGRSDPALDAFRGALAQQPDSVAARLGSGQALQAMGRRADADAAYAAVLEREPGNVIALNNRAWLAAEDRRNLDQAEGWARRAVDLAPGSAATQATLGWVLRARSPAGGRRLAGSGEPDGADRRPLGDARHDLPGTGPPG